MTKTVAQPLLIRTGDLSGLGSVYDNSGHLILEPGERVLRSAEGWDMQAKLGWRRFLPHVLFDGFNGPVQSTLYLTTSRVVLIRKIDAWRETKGEMSALGIPGGVAKAANLSRLAELGAREYCEFIPERLRISRVRRLKKQRAWLYLNLAGDDGLNYAILIWKAEGDDEQTAALLESQFSR